MLLVGESCKPVNTAVLALICPLALILPEAVIWDVILPLISNTNASVLPSVSIISPLVLFGTLSLVSLPPFLNLNSATLLDAPSSWWITNLASPPLSYTSKVAPDPPTGLSIKAVSAIIAPPTTCNGLVGVVVPIPTWPFSLPVTVKIVVLPDCNNILPVAEFALSFKSPDDLISPSVLSEDILNIWLEPNLASASVVNLKWPPSNTRYFYTPCW